MADDYRLFGSELSPYSVKVRSYLRYKNIPHEWVIRSGKRMAEFQQHARLPLIPLLLAPDGSARQDSTPIIEALEAQYPEPAIQPSDPSLAFLSALIEEYADEWGNKAMFHYRWTYEPDQRSTAERLVREATPAASVEDQERTAKMVIGRMVPRLSFVGSSPETGPQIERSYARQLALLELHLVDRPYLFGGRPAFGDFGLAAQLYECSTDPTPGARMRADAPRVSAWVEKMLEPKAKGEFESWAALEPTLLPLLRDEIGGLFLPWSNANARALADGRESFEVKLEGTSFSQGTQKYHARSLKALRARYAEVPDSAELDDILSRAGCLDLLSQG